MYSVLTITKPCCVSFSPTSDYLTAYKDGQIYHARPVEGLGELSINFPLAGKYKVSGIERKISPLKRFLFKSVLPAKERNLKQPISVKIIHEKSPHLAYVIKELNTVFVNDDFMRAPIQVQDFILNHELGHYLYETEHYCDLFAYKKFLEKGFNPSQAFIALNNYLRPTRDNEKRVNELLTIIKKSYE